MSLAEIHKKAKLVMIPSGFKADEILYSVLPSDGSGNFTASGDTDSTRVNKDGLIEKVTTLVPRLNYDFGNPKNPHLLLESQRTNKLGYSEDFSNAYWTKTNINTSSSNFNVTTSPDGSINADKLVPDTTSGQHKIDRTETVTNGATVALSVFVKKAEYEFCCLYEVNSSKGKFFDLSNGTIGGDFVGTPTTSKIESFDNDWFRVSLTTTVPSTSARWILYVCNTISNTSFAGDNSKGIFVWGTQLEEGAFETSYIPATSTAGVTRTVDTCNSAGNSSIINTSEGVLFAEIAALANDSSLRDISINNNSTDRILLSYLNSSNRIAMQFIDGGISQFTLQFDGATITNFNKIAIKYKSSDYALWVNGSERATNTSHTNALAGLDRINFDRGDGGDDFFGKCKQLMYFDTILTDAELTTLTT
jgi:hypothetical protein